MTVLEQRQQEPCNCPSCRHNRMVESIRKTLLPPQERIQAARAALLQALNLLDEISGKECCDCPKCAPERWDAGPLGTWIKDGNENDRIEPFTCKHNLQQ